MKEFFGGLVLGALLGGGGLYAVQTYVLDPADEREPEPQPEPIAELESDTEGEPKRKRRRKRRSKRGADAAAGEDAGSGPPLDDDSKVPHFDPKHDRTIGMGDGTGRLSDSQVDRELAKLDKNFRRCVSEANQRVAELGTGKVTLGFGIAGTGKVTGVNVGAPSNLKDAGIVPCVRKAIYGHKFPAFDGPEMSVSSSFSID